MLETGVDTCSPPSVDLEPEGGDEEVQSTMINPSCPWCQSIDTRKVEVDFSKVNIQGLEAKAKADLSWKLEMSELQRSFQGERHPTDRFKRWVFTFESAGSKGVGHKSALFNF